MKSWYALQTKYQQEQSVETALKVRGYNAYCPLTLTDKRRITTYATFKCLTEPLFPMYLFVQMSEGEDDFYPITKTPGVTNIVKMTEREDGYLYPTIIPVEIIAVLKAHEDEQGIHSNHKVDYEKGDRIMITEGSFIDYPAEIFSTDKHKRAIVLVEIFNRLSQVEVDYRNIVPL